MSTSLLVDFPCCMVLHQKRAWFAATVVLLALDLLGTVLYFNYTREGTYCGHDLQFATPWHHAI